MESVGHIESVIFLIIWLVSKVLSVVSIGVAALILVGVTIAKDATLARPARDSNRRAEVKGGARASRRRFPPKQPWTLTHAHEVVADVAAWARRMGFHEVGPRLEWAAAVIKHEMYGDPADLPKADKK